MRESAEVGFCTCWTLKPVKFSRPRTCQAHVPRGSYSPTGRPHTGKLRAGHRIHHPHPLQNGPGSKGLSVHQQLFIKHLLCAPPRGYHNEQETHSLPVSGWQLVEVMGVKLRITSLDEKGVLWKVASQGDLIVNP